MRISACRGKQIALLNIEYTPKIGRGNYLIYLFKSILINKGWKRHLPVCFLNCVSLAIWNLIHSHNPTHRCFYLKWQCSQWSFLDKAAIQFRDTYCSLFTVTAVSSASHIQYTTNRSVSASWHSLTVICVSCLKSRTWDTNLSAFSVGGDKPKHRLDWNCTGMKRELFFTVIVPFVTGTDVNLVSQISLWVLYISYVGSHS